MINSSRYLFTWGRIRIWTTTVWGCMSENISLFSYSYNTIAPLPAPKWNTYKGGYFTACLVWPNWLEIGCCFMQTCVLIFMGNFGHITLWIAKHCQNKGFSEEWLFNVQNNRTSNEIVRWIHKGDNIDCVTKLQQNYIHLDPNMWIVKWWNQIKQAGRIQAKLV